MRRGRSPKPEVRLRPLVTYEQNRDMYGFMVRPQHLESYRKHVTIYKEEEAERSDRWEQFLSATNDNVPAPACDPASLAPRHRRGESSELEDGGDAGNLQTNSNSGSEKGAGNVWGQLRESLRSIEQASILRDRGVYDWSAKQPVHSNGINANSLSVDNRRKESSGRMEDRSDGLVHPGRILDDGTFSVNKTEAESNSRSGDDSGDDSEDEFCDATESADVLGEAETTLAPPPIELPWEEELRSLVRDGVPMALRGELWQVFVGTKARRLGGHYNALLSLLGNGTGDSNERRLSDGDAAAANYLVTKSGVLEKWASQIEKDLPRTFPGHPALDEDGRNTLRRLLTAYARHNPSVGYCQAMNFLAGLLLLLMPEENAFWTLTAIIDDYFEGYYSEKMVEAQVDQLVFEDLVREKFPRLVSHLDNLGVQVAWVSGPWFLSIFVNVLPWESVLRVWDVLLYEGNRCMLFRTGLALMEIHAAALSTTRDAGDAVAMLQSMANDTFDSSQLVLVACMGYQTVTEARLQELRLKRRPEVLAALQERSIELHLWRNSNNSMAQKLPYLYRIESSGGENLLIKKSIVVSEGNGNDASLNGISHDNGGASDQPASVRGPVSFEENSLEQAIAENITPRSTDDDHHQSDALEQVAWLKNELCRALEDQKAASARAAELEVALVEMVQEDNRRLLSAKVEQLEAEVSTLKQLLSDKQVQEEALLEVLVRMEQEQKIADDARRFAEMDSTAQRRAAEVFQEKCERAADALAEMEKRAVMAESMLEATLSYQALGNNLSPNPSSVQRPPDSHLKRPPELPGGSVLQKSVSLGDSNHLSSGNGSVKLDVDESGNKQGIFNRSFGLNWRDRSKARSGRLNEQNRTVSEPSPDQSSALTNELGSMQLGATIDEAET